jgi:siderophore synthetase component
VTALTAVGPTALAATAAASALGDAAPHLLAGFRENLPRAADVVDRRLVAAAYREGLTGERSAVYWSDGQTFLPAKDGGYVVTRARRHAFDRIEIQERLTADPARLLGRLAGSGDGAVATELSDATVNLALAYARRASISEQLLAQALETGALDSLDLAAGLDPDEQCVFFERLSTEGHNLHPCGRTRIGWTVGDLLAHDLESDITAVGFVGVRRSIHIGDDVGRQLLPDLSIDHGRYAVTPVHAWQLDRVVRGPYADLVADGTLVPLGITIPATPTAALRTLMLPTDSDGTRRYLKASLDIQITSTRRTISVASTRNGPILSALLADLLDTDRVVLMAETAGSATVASGGRDRDLAAILRSGLSGRLAAYEVAVSGGALYAISPVTGTTVVAEIVTRFARTRGLTERAGAALAFVGEYARLLLPPVLTLATRYGIGLEAHLQNCVPTFVDGVPHRLALRDFAGLRVYPPRLPAPLPLWPGSVVVTDDADVMRSKVAYTALQAHLGEIVIRLVESHNLDEPAAWSAVRRVVEEVYEDLRGDPAVADRAGEDHAFLTAPTLPHKALLTMRLQAARGQTGDIYVRVENPLR